MTATDFQSSLLGRISMIRRNNQIASMEDHESEHLDFFQKKISDGFSDLLSDPILSIGWLRRLLDVFLCCEEEFKGMLIMGHREFSHFIKPPLDRLLPDLLDRSVKALDICNALTDGLECMQRCQVLADIAVVALSKRPLCEGHVRRANKALCSLLTLIAMLDKESGNNNGGKSTERSWSFGRRSGGNNGGSSSKGRHVGQCKYVSWSVSKSWSAAKQIHAMTSNLNVPRGAEATGMAFHIYVMNTVAAFVMWALVAALPCQERNGLSSHFPMSKQFAWTSPMIGLQDKIGEEWKKKEKKGTAGLLEEMQRMEKLGQCLVEFAEGFQFPAAEEKLEEVTVQVAELSEICRKMEEGLVPLRMQIREVFHRIMRSRAEFLDASELAGKSSAASM